MIKIGITGGIGSGKTTVCHIFEMLGIPVYYADEQARSLMQNNDHLIRQIKKAFGEESYENGNLNRAYVAQIVFNDRRKLAQLNALVHPTVAEDFLNWATQQKQVPYVLEEAAVMIESGNYRLMDQIIVVSAPLETRIERVMKRDQVSRENILSRMKNQLSEEKRLEYADFVIKNSDTDFLIPQILELHRKFS